MVLPSINSYMRTSSVDSGKVLGNLMFLSIIQVLNLSMFLFYWVKQSCSAKMSFIDQEVTGTSNFLEKIEKNLLNMNSKSMSFYKFLPISGCLTFTATIQSFNLALQTCATEPEATGVQSNSSKISFIYFPQTLFIIYSVSFRECQGEFSLKTVNLTAISYPIISLRWLKYWKALIQTNPALFIADRNTPSQNSLVVSNKQSGKRTIEGRKMKPSSMKRMKYIMNFLILLVSSSLGIPLGLSSSQMTGSSFILQQQKPVVKTAGTRTNFVIFLIQFLLLSGLITERGCMRVIILNISL